MHALGIDIGGTGIKAAPVDVTTGMMLAQRTKILTPRPATPDAVAEVVRQLTGSFDWSGPIGIAYPGVVMDGVTHTSANLHRDWIGLDAQALLGKVAGQEVQLVNDADAAGVAEMSFGAGRGQRGTVLVLTFGTGIGSALFTDGALVPNTEFGHMEIRGKDAETRASEYAKRMGDLNWKQWTKRVEEYLRRVEGLVSPRLVIIGGGISKSSDKFLPLLSDLRAQVVPAAMHNNAGIVGAAMASHLEPVVPAPRRPSTLTAGAAT
jgi:polyphosphate glucokinase